MFSIKNVRQSLRSASLNGMTRSTEPLGLRIRITRERRFHSRNRTRAPREQEYLSRDREQECQPVTHKERIAAQCELNATLAAERMTDKLQGTDNIPLSTLVPAFGVSVDKLAVLRGHAPSVNIANILMPRKRARGSRARHDKLDAIARRLSETQTPSK